MATPSLPHCAMSPLVCVYYPFFFEFFFSDLFFLSCDLRQHLSSTLPDSFASSPAPHRARVLTPACATPMPSPCPCARCLAVPAPAPSLHLLPSRLWYGRGGVKVDFPPSLCVVLHVVALPTAASPHLASPRRRLHRTLSLPCRCRLHVLALPCTPSLPRCSAAAAAVASTSTPSQACPPCPGVDVEATCMPSAPLCAAVASTLSVPSPLAAPSVCPCPRPHLGPLYVWYVLSPPFFFLF